MLTVERLREVLRYYPETGMWEWLKPTSNRCTKGHFAGTLTCWGYLTIGVDGHHYRAHRLAWLYMTGVWPIEVDHDDTDRANNQWLNLRLATRTLNNGNRTSSRVGFLKGAYWDSRRNRWYSSIKSNDVQEWLGYHDTEQAAHEAYVAAAIRLFGEFARAA